MRTEYRVMRSTILLLSFFILVSCSSIPDLNITYRLPARSDELKGKRVSIAFEDMRGVQDILGEGAKKELMGFSGNISLSLARHKEKGFKLGLYDLRSLFMETFKRKLENSGMTVISERKTGQPELVLVLKRFFLDLVKRRWITRMEYEVRLVVNGKVRSNQIITGEGERYKIVKHAQADTVLGEIFTDILNRVDVGRLFMQANLRPG